MLSTDTPHTTLFEADSRLPVKIWTWCCLLFPLAVLISIAAANILLVVAVLGAVVFFRDTDIKEVRLPLIMIGSYLAWTFITVALAPYQSHWLDWLEERSTFLALIPGLVIGARIARAQLVLKLFSIYLVIIALYAAVQYFFGFDLARMESIRPHMGHFRAIGLQNNALTFAGMVALTVPLTMGFQAPRGWPAWIMALCGGIAISAAMARAILLGFLGGGVVFLFLGTRKLKIAGAVLILALLILPRTIFTSTGERLTQGDETRLYLWQSALNIIQAYPLTGVGENNWPEAFEEYGVEYDAYKNTAHAHNDYLTTALENGLMGLVLMVMMWGSILVLLLRWAFKSRGEERDLALGFFAAFGVILFGGLFQNFQTDAENALLIWFLVGMGARSTVRLDRGA